MDWTVKKVRWIKNWLNGQTQRAVIGGGAKYSQSPVMSGVFQVSVLGLVLFYIFITDLDDGVEYILSKFADDPKSGGVIAVLEGHVVIQNDLSRFDKWADGDLKVQQGEDQKSSAWGRTTSKYCGSSSWKAALQKKM